MIIKFLQDCTVNCSHIYRCSEGCCSEVIWENDQYLKGEEIEYDEDEHRYDISHLKEGEDYIKLI